MSSLENGSSSSRPRDALLRWRLLRHYLLATPGVSMEDELRKVSRRPYGCFGLIPYQLISSQKVDDLESNLEIKHMAASNTLIEYTLAAKTVHKVALLQRWDNALHLHDFKISREYEVDNTGIVGIWPAEEILTYFCISHPTLFRNKKILELGSGYGLAGLAIGVCTQAAEVLITDGNPQVVKYLEQNINANQTSFGNTIVSSSLLHWCSESFPHLENKFDLVIAADCTFFKATHFDLARTVTCLLKRSNTSHALFFSPRRGQTLDYFVDTVRSLGLQVRMEERYDAYIWDIHQQILKGKRKGWPNYASDHCYPLLVSATHT